MDTRKAAIKFIKGLSASDRQNVKEMLSHGVTCGTDFARRHDIPPMSFSDELRMIFSGK